MCSDQVAALPAPTTSVGTSASAHRWQPVSPNGDSGSGWPARTVSDRPVTRTATPAGRLPSATWNTLPAAGSEPEAAASVGPPSAPAQPRPWVVWIGGRRNGAASPRRSRSRAATHAPACSEKPSIAAHNGPV
jgi:hypothetical protein